MGDIQPPFFWFDHWLRRLPWWVGEPLFVVWFPVGLLLYFLVVPFWWGQRGKGG